MNDATKQFTIIGAGIAGLTTAIALRRLGLNPVLFEAAPTIRPVGAGLGLAANAIKAFRALDLADGVMAAGRLLDALVIQDEKGRIITRTDSRAISQKYGTDNFTIHRADLHQILLDHVGHTPIRLGKRAVGVEQTMDGVAVQFADGTHHQTDYLLVADGIQSPIRQQLVPQSVPRYAGYTAWRAVIDGAGLPLTEATETWGTRGRVGLVPLADDKLYWFATINAGPSDARFRQFTPRDLAAHFASYPAPIPDILAHTPDERLLWNDIIDLKPLPQYAFGKVVLLGDAAHATTPNMGQGACQAIEDAVVLADELKKGGDVPAAFERFEQRRLKRTHAIIQTSRRIGQLAQTENSLLARLRNGLFRLLPAGVNERQLETLYRVDF